MVTPVQIGLHSVLGAPFGIPAGAPTQTLLHRTSENKQPPPPEVPGQNLKRAVNYLADYGGCGFYRCLSSNLLLNLYEKAVIIESTAMILDPRFYGTVEAVKVQRQATPHQRDFIKMVKEISKQKPLKLIYEVDDVVFAEDIPMYNRNRDAFISSEIQNSIKEILPMMDEIVVTTEYFRDYIKNKTGLTNVSYVPNYLMKWWFDRYYDLGKLIKNYEKNKKRPIVAIFASGTHVDVLNRVNQQDDFQFVVEDIIKTRRDFDWRFYGSYPLPLKPFIDRGEIKFFNWTKLPEFPQSMANSGAQLTFAALQNNEFNLCKSNIKYLESAALGIPCVSPDLVTYKDADIKYTHNNGKEFIDCIKTVLKNQTIYASYCKKARAYAETMWLDDEKNLMKHHETYFTPFGSPDRKFLLT